MARIIRAFYRSQDYVIRVEETGTPDQTYPKENGKPVPGYLADRTQFANYREKNESLTFLNQPYGMQLEQDISWLKSHPRPAHRDVFPRGEIVDEENGMKVVKVLKNVTLLDMLEVLKEFIPQR